MRDSVSKNPLVRRLLERLETRRRFTGPWLSGTRAERRRFGPGSGIKHGAGQGGLYVDGGYAFGIERISGLQYHVEVDDSDR
jgi:hypothetical protein